jgi:hypothetical protein
MTADVAEVVGVEPAYVYRPPRVSSLLPKVEKVCKTVGRFLEPEQAVAVDVLTGLKADGSPASLNGAVIAPRQNLKTYVLENIILTRLLDPHDSARLFIWTAQQLTTTKETFLHFKDLFESKEHPHLRRRLKNISSGKGSEEIELTDGRRLMFKARSEKSGQGLTGDVIVLDEAFALEAEHMGALLPTLSTRRRAMILYGSSAGHPNSEVLRGVRDRGRKGERGAPAYVEWCAPGSWDEPGCLHPGCRHTTDMVGCSLDRHDFVQAANAMAGRRIGWEYLADERVTLPPHEFGRERLGWWDEPDESGVPPISVDDWRARLDSESAVAEAAPVVFAAEIALDRRSASIAVAGWRDDGKAHVGLIEHDHGTDWLLPRLLELVDRNQTHVIERGGKRSVGLVLDPASPAGDLVDSLRKAKVEPVLMTARDVAASCGGLQDAVEDGLVWHRDQPAVDVALGGAVKRDLGDGGWAFGRRKSAAVSVDVTPIVAVANARWGLSVVKRRTAPQVF